MPTFDFLSGMTFSRRIKMLAAGLWLLALLTAGLWIGVPRLPTEVKAPVEDVIEPVAPKLKTPLLVVGVIILASAPAYTGGSVYLLRSTRRRQAENNLALGQVGVVQWLSVPASDKTKWKTAADMWARVRSPLVRPDFEILRGRGVHVSFEVVAVEGDGIYWLMWAPDVRELDGSRQAAQDLPGTLGNALAGYNPRMRVVKIEDPLAKVAGQDGIAVQWIELGLSAPSHYPINTEFDADPVMALVSGILTDGNVVMAGFQVLTRPAGNWQAPGRKELAALVQAQAEMSSKLIGKAEKERKLAIEAKLDQFGFETVLRFFAVGSDPQALSYRLRAVQDTMGQYQGLNAFTVVNRGDDAATLLNRAFPPRLDPINVLNVGELAVLYHLPNSDWEPVTGVKWSPARVIAPAAPVIRGWGVPEHAREILGMQNGK